MKKLLFLTTFLAIFAPPSVSWAKHIVGGEITYRFVSRTGNTVRLAFEMRIYRDCNSVESAGYDDPAYIGIFGRNSGALIESFGVRREPIQRVAAPNYPCLIPPDICVEEAAYRWEKDLPINAEGYNVVYQRCCRNETITNIMRPGDFGATYNVEITREALIAGNSSPTFRSFPPTIICANSPLNFDHGAIDAEGDRVTYEFCQPLAGGGKENVAGCTATQPNPPCFPPPNTIIFRAPSYSATQPMGGNPIVSINSQTGLITGTPTVIGQFVVGVCVREFRNGVLMSVLRRDFQFNVASCKPKVEGIVGADTVITRNFINRICGANTHKVNNLSLDRSFITNFYFLINLGGGAPTRFNDWEPTITFPDTGIYTGKLLLNPNTTCADSINLTFNVAPPITTEFTYSYDTCVAGAIDFRDRSFVAGPGVAKRLWEFEPLKFDSTLTPQYQYQQPGIKPVKLTITDTKGCQKQIIKNITWYPVPAFLVVEPTTFVGCTPAEIVFKNLSKPIDSTYKVEWTFGDGGTSNKISPIYVYKTPGIYSVGLKITSPIGCSISNNYPNWINIKQGAAADFTYTPTQLTSFNNTAIFKDRSLFTNRWNWRIDDNFGTNIQNPVYTFQDTGVHKVRLIASNQFGCSDTLIKYLDVIPQVTYFLPNVFSPNGDGKNEEFQGVGFFDGMKDFKMKILNRWGEVVFETNTPDTGWNGQKNNTGQLSPQDVYLCIVTYTTPRGEKSELKGYATLLR